MKVRRILALAFMLGLLIPSNLATAVTPLVNPSSIQVLAAEGYNDILETGDQLYLVVYDIFYADADDRPTATASETILVRLSSSSGTHAVSAPLTFAHRGYVRGMTGFYFANADTDKPTWTDATLIAQVAGNPALTWASGQPLSNAANPADNTAATSEAQQAAITTFMRTQVPILEINWREQTGLAVELISGQPNVLTPIGEEYFALSSPDQRNITPDLFAFTIFNPDIISYGRTVTTAAALALDVTVTVNEAERTGLKIGQEITIIGAAVWETVTLSNVVGNVLTFAPALVNPYALGSAVWITAQELQGDINVIIAGSFLETILVDGAANWGMSETMFGTILGILLSLFIGGVALIIARNVEGNGTLLIGLVATFLAMMFWALMGILPLVSLGIMGTILVTNAVYQVYWRFG